MSHNPRVFIIILNWNGFQDTIECLKSLERVAYPNFEAVVVDNASTDESVFRIEQYNGTAPRKCVLFPGKENLGFSGGNNIGIRYALENGADYVLVLNNDTVVEPDFVGALVEVAESDHRIGMVGARILFYGDRSKVWHLAGGSFSWLTGSRPYGYGMLDTEAIFPSRRLDFVTAACVLVSRSALEQAGLLDERYFLYYEDVEWSLRMKKAGFRLSYAEKARIYHKVHASTIKISDPIVWYYHVRNVLLTVRIHAPWYVKSFVFLWAGWRWYVKQYIKLLAFPSRKSEAVLIQKGFMDFWQGKFGKLSSSL